MLPHFETIHYHGNITDIKIQDACA